MIVRRILLIQLKRIGDFILTAPAVAELRALHPEAEIVMLVPDVVKDLARSLPAVDRVMRLKAGRPNLEAWVSAAAGGWDVCLDFTGTDRSAFLTRLSHAKRRIGYAKFADSWWMKQAYTELCDASVRDLHTVDFHRALVSQIGNGEPANLDVSPSLEISTESLSRARRLRFEAGSRGRYAIVHPGTAREEKFWLNDRWANVIENLRTEHDLEVLLTGSGDGLEKPHLTELKKHLQLPVSDLTGQLTLVELAALISECEIIVGVDSMAMHLASLLQKPQIALFGPTNPFHWRPQHDRGLVVVPHETSPLQAFEPRAKGGEMNHLSTDTVLSAMRILLPQT